MNKKKALTNGFENKYKKKSYQSKLFYFFIRQGKDNQ